jgi:CheY-like chemotaxis protein
MSAIIGMTELALGTDLDVEQREYLEIIEISAQALLTLVNDILDLSKIEAGRMELDEAAFSVRDLVSDVVRSFTSSASEKGVDISHEVPLSIPETLVGDPGRLRQVLTNLVGNAVKFTSQGTIRISISPESVGDDSVVLRFAVADTGIGIPPDQQAVIFSKFTQADGTSTRRHGGTGLGLAIASEIVALMDGRMWVSSEIGEGSTFHFTATLGVLADEPELQATVDDVSPRPVLVIAATTQDRQRLSELLQQVDLAPITMADAGLAAATVTFAQERGAKPQAVVIADDVDRFAIAERLIEETGNEIPVILVVRSGQRGDAAQCRRIGVAGYLTEPYTAADLHDVMRTVLAPESSAAQQDTVITRHWLRERRRALHVLVADDNPTNRQVALRLLERRGHTAVGVENGRDAVTAAQEARYDVILMDVQMPVMDGLQATGHIRSHEAVHGIHTPIVALTAHAMDSDRARCLNAGMDEYLAKPFRPEKLYETIETLAGLGQVEVEDEASEPEYERVP